MDTFAASLSTAGTAQTAPFPVGAPGATVDMERGIARCRIALSLIAILALYVDPTEPSMTRWLPLSGGAFTINWYWATVLIAHLVYSLTLAFIPPGLAPSTRSMTRIATIGDVLFAVAIAAVTEGTTSPFYTFFTFAVLAAALRSGLRLALAVTAVSTALYVLLVVTSAPANQVFFIVMRAAYIAITGYLVGYLGQERLNQEARIRQLETSMQREQIARSLHDGYAQALAGVNLRVETCRELLRRGQHDDALGELTDLQSGVTREHDQLREYIRSLVELEPPAARATVPSPTHVVVEADFSSSAPMVEHVLLMMLEGTRNVRRHSSARAAHIQARNIGQELVVTIDDDGVGFPADAAVPWSIASRVAECGGRVSFDGRAGAHVRIHIPGA